MRIWILALVVGTSTPAVAGPWSPQQGDGYIKVWNKVLLASRFTDRSGQTRSTQGYRELFLSTYGEVGLGADLAAIWQWDLARVFSLDGIWKAGVGDPELGLRYAPVRWGPLALGAEIALRAPLASSTTFAQLRDESGAPAAQASLGAGVWEGRASLVVGAAWRALFISGSFGYALRSRFADELRWTVEAGGQWWRLGGKLGLNGVHALGSSAGSVELAGGRGDGASSTGIALELYAEPWQGGSVGLTTEFSLFGLGLVSQPRGLVLSLFVGSKF